MNWLSCRGQRLDLSQPIIMGVLNVTPDSFSDGGRWLKRDDALTHARQMLDEGAKIIDIGGESTRPGADSVDETTELQRVIPIIQALHEEFPDALLSIDTSKPEVMQAALDAGAHIINDVNALQAEGALQVAADSDSGICLMHMRGKPADMQKKPEYDDVLEDVSDFLDARQRACIKAGVARERIALDPGFGFGKTLQHNLQLLAGMSRLSELGRPLLAGLSRKSMLEQITGAPVGERLIPSVTAAVLAAQQGAAIMRVHDVAATRQGLQVWQAMRDHA